MQDTKAQAPPRGALSALAGGYFTLAVASLSVVGLLGHMSAGLAVSTSAVAYLVTAFALTYAVAAPTLQMMVGDLDRRTLILIGLCTIAAGAVTNALAWTYETALAGRCIMAIGASVVGPMASAAGAALVAAERRGAALGYVFAGFTVATVIGVPLTAYSGDTLGWRATMVLVAALALAVAFAVAITVPGGSRGTKANLRSVARALTGKRTGFALVVTLFQMAGQFVTFAVIAAYMVERFDLPVASVPLILFLFGVGGIVGNLIATRLVDVLGPERLILNSLLVTAAILMMLQFAPGKSVVGVLLMFAWSVTGMLIYAPQQARLVALAPKSGNLLLALNASMLYAGMAAGALLSGLLYELNGAQHLALGSSLLMVVGAGAFLLSRRFA